MPAAAIPAVTLAVAAIGTGYGIYASQRAASQARQQYNDAQAAAQQQQAQQQAMLQQQQTQQQAQLASQAQQQSDAAAKQQAMEQSALSNAQAQIAPTQQALGQNLLAQEQQAYTKMTPQMEARLNALGLLQSGALPEAQAKYQADLESQRQAALATYGTNANQALQQQALNYAGNDVSQLNTNLANTLTAQQQALQNQFQDQDIAYSNNVAQQQYLSNLGAANTAAQQAQANQYMNLGGQLAQGGLSYWGSQNKPQTTPSTSAATSTGMITPSTAVGASQFTPYNPNVAAYEKYFNRSYNPYQG